MDKEIEKLEKEAKEKKQKLMGDKLKKFIELNKDQLDFEGRSSLNSTITTILGYADHLGFFHDSSDADLISSHILDYLKDEGYKAIDKSAIDNEVHKVINYTYGYGVYWDTDEAAEMYNLP